MNNSALAKKCTELCPSKCTEVSLWVSIKVRCRVRVINFTTVPCPLFEYKWHSLMARGLYNRHRCKIGRKIVGPTHKLSPYIMVAPQKVGGGLEPTGLVEVYAYDNRCLPARVQRFPPGKQLPEASVGTIFSPLEPRP